MTIIPLPVKVKETGGRCVITPNTVIRVVNADSAVVGVGEYLAEFLAVPMGARLAVAGGAGTGRGEIRLALGGEAALGEEGDQLTATPEAVTIRARSAAGVFYGVQSLLQLLPVEVFAGKPARGAVWALPCVEIEDRPRFGWRGMMLDVSSHFLPVAFLKRWIDLLAMYKMNVFHWHLMDFGGWRLEIKAYPRLTDVGAWRAGDGKGSLDLDAIFFRGRDDPEGVYGGFYTQAEVRDVVAYAARRFVRVVPEIEMPGHSFETLAVYPELRCLVEGNDRQDAFCAGSEKTFEFLEAVLSETMDLFPDEFIHIGGDEVPKGYWARCPLCQARMKAQGLESPDELQSYFTNRIERFVSGKGRRVIGWDEILEGPLSPQAAVMSYRIGVDGGQAAATGHDVVMTPGTHCYFDYYQSTDFAHEPQRMGLLVPVETVYAYEPIPPGLAADKHRHVLGAQGNVWTAMMDSQAVVEYMSLPRMSALAEVVWSPAQGRQWKNFEGRLSEHFRRLDQMGVTYRNGVPRPVPELAAIFSTGPATVAFEPPPPAEEDLVLRYTCDGADPGPASPLYQGPLHLTSEAIVKAVHFRPDGQRSNVTAVTFARVPHVDPASLEPGLDARYAEGVWHFMPPLAEFAHAPVQKVINVDLTIRRQQKFSALWFTGFLRIEAAGVYTFTTGSGDGSLLQLGPATIVNNDGLHGYHECSAPVLLAPGLYPLAIGCFQARWGDDLQVFLQPPAGEKQPLPARLLFRPRRK
ncbi:MAG: family 20 glycosylhydrolase [Planctomycetota bacterium]|nr:family 20 glycosylhydrolase [Planctomycetota bacterium]